MVLQKHFGTDWKSFSMSSPNFSHTLCFASATAEAAALRVCRYLATASGVLRDNKSRKDSFFSRTASLTTGVHHDVRGLPPLEAPRTLRPQLPLAASAIEVLNIDHSDSMSPTFTGMCEKLRRRPGMVGSPKQGNQMNNLGPGSPLITHPYVALGQITSPYDQQQPDQDLNVYASLKAVAEKANKNLYTNQQHVVEMTTKGNLPMEPVDMEPEPSNPYSPAKQPSVNQNGHKYRKTKVHNSHFLAYGTSSNTVAYPGRQKGWESKDSGVRQTHGPKKHCNIEKERHTTRYMVSKPYFVTNSKTEVTV
ncbi:protein shisa-9B-like [Polymixia lowei]